ncbi:MAG: TIM barrel protein [Amylibacter sp.]|nr:TIM barrel protein [Amylibacter sp.]
MPEFSANLGFLYTEFSLPDAIRAAAEDGFDAVECHWPYMVPAGTIKQVLSDTGLTMLGLNTVRGKTAENGLAALVGRQVEARAAIDQAIEYAAAIGALNVHVMAGITRGGAATDCFVENLQYACAKAAPLGITILIEPLNDGDAPGYFLQYSAQAQVIIERVGSGNLKLMFDCYHLQIMEGNLLDSLEKLMPIIGHIQIASVPDRAEPDHGNLDYKQIVNKIETLRYTQPIGAEYKPATTTRAGLGWLRGYQN